ncbi:hypothetical protein [Prevotella pectinovora]|uniref:hypothetical protein n=1 Tax=Prevotella pectinovora TaxID=1602169 RepID=UPI003080B486
MAKKRNNTGDISLSTNLNGLFEQPKKGLFYDDKGKSVEKEYYQGPNGTFFTYDKNYNAVPLLMFDQMSPQELEKWRRTAPNSPYRKDMDKVKTRQAVMRAAGLDVPDNGLWDNAQQAAWNKLTRKSKDYGTALMDLAQATYDKATGNDTYKDNPFLQDEVKTYDPNNVDWSKTRRSQSAIINAIEGTWGPIVATALAPTLLKAAISAPLTTLATTIGGSLGGKAVDRASKAITGRDFSTNVAMYSPLTPEMGEILNPGYLAGGYGAERRMLDALYNQVTPISYGTAANSSFGTKGKLEELGLAVKDFFTPKRIKTSVTDTPAWRQRVEQNNTAPSIKGQTIFRDDAWRLATRQKARTIDIDGKPYSLYIKNPDGTYSYDFDYIDKVRANVGMPLLKDNHAMPLIPNNGIYKEGLNKGYTKDSFTTNGGVIGVDFTLPKGWNTDPNRVHPKQIILKEPYRIHDKWDLQFLKDENASFAPAFTRWLTRHPNKLTNYIRNMDALEAVGGNPFMLDMQVSPDIIRTMRKP